MHLRAVLLIVSLLFSSLHPAFALAPTAPAAPAPANPQLILFGFADTGLNPHARDVGVRPGDDFNLHANGSWIGFVRGRGAALDFSYSIQAQLNEDVEAQIRSIIENPAGDPASQQIRSLFAGFMDTARIEQAGLAPLRPYLDRIASIRNRADLIDVFAANGYNMPLSLGIIPDPQSPSRYVAAVGQGGLLMPTRDFYLRQGPEFDRYRTAYRTYATTLLRLAGQTDVEAKAQRIFDLERRLAEGQWPPERSRDISQVYNPMTPAQLARLAPQYDWPRLLPALRLGSIDRLVVGETTALTAAGRLIEEVSLDTWKEWLTFHFIDTFAPYMSQPFDQAAFEFNQRALYGMPQQHARWRRGVQFVEGAFGEAVGRIYLARHFPPESGRVVDGIIGNMRAAFGERLRRNTWMDEPTRAEALAKLTAFEARIGGPVRTTDYSGVRIDQADMVGNILRLGEFAYAQQVDRLTQPVDRNLWQMTAHTVGASYNVLTNQITFPAGILQRPLFHPTYDAAVNYGRIGSAIGHELGHGFDDQGRRFDGSGRLRDWWTPAAAERFTALTRRLGQQFAAYEPVSGFRVNAENTMGENIGDLGGLEIAYDAYRRHVAQHGEPPVVNGLTGDQRFFLSYAQTWCGHYSDNLMRTIVLTDEHAPPAYRVNGIVRNMDAWYRAFNVQPGDRLYLAPEQRVRIW